MPSDAPPPPSLEMVRWLWAFHEWATAHVFDAAACADEAVLRRPVVIPGGQGDGSIWDTLGHIAGAEEHWTNRWLGNPSSELKGGSSYADLRTMIDDWWTNNQRLRGWLTRLRDDELAGQLHYYRTNGEARQNVLWHTLLHVANHSTHHRAEACTALTAAGSAPHGVDMIDWIRAGCPGA
ncbi:MAG TPA: DinB family protein [Tepidiformaceae bacterium]|nr:DinB family protein [Tepidiformaceae bacterium]